MRKTRNTPGSTHQSSDRRTARQGTRRAADERVATILLAPNFVRPTGSVENLPEQTTRDTRETAKRAKRSLEEGGATRKVRGAEKEYTVEYYRDRRTVSVHAWRGAIDAWYPDAWSLRQSSFHTWSKCGCHPCRARTRPSYALWTFTHKIQMIVTDVTQVRSSLFSRPFSSPLHTWPWITIGESFYVSSTVLTCI